ncbi:hypothetical protein M3Y14_34090 (plasmid) [Bacillus thuringiensis]|uniref:hypothetical protein n=1 Tax=Bacillus thuringiensis TaxID=1428 RepID=UPI0022241DEB|nr:hypothetical protein [Bacillus thuringiensis]UYX56280.1 hypothetical protein M3Y14_34090 [Bacillus thuringiensis]
MTVAEKEMLYRITAQTADNELTIRATTSNDVSLEEAIDIALKDVLVSPKEKYRHFTVEPICTKEDWKEGVVSFCPRCGINLKDSEIGKGGVFDCYDCNTTIEAHILGGHEEDED